ncbi:MAG: class I SAM-dependent methyltransferase [Pseudomonadota bacterium]
MASQSEWSGDLGRTWGAWTQVMDRMLAPFGDVAMQRLGKVRGKMVLDLGCGAGETACELALRVGSTGTVVGVDISEDLISLASKERDAKKAENLALLCADASKLSLGSPADALYSRFGAMFFDKPADAWARLRANLAPRARASIICWRTFKENPWALVPYSAAADLLPAIDPPPPGAPGPFAWGVPEKSVFPVLEGSGWQKVKVKKVDRVLTLGPGMGGDPLEDAVDHALAIGPVASRASTLPAAAKRKVRARVKEALSQHMEDGAVRLKGACWLVRARA